MTKQINKKILFILLIFITLVLVLAFVIEHKFDQNPCKLCIYQRVPYFLAILLLAKTFFIDGYEKVTLLILFLVFIISSILGFYHFGIEEGFFEESLVCKTENFSDTLTKHDLLKKLSENSISCKDVSIRILGFSLAAINTIFSIILSVIFGKLFINYGKN